MEGSGFWCLQNKKSAVMGGMERENKLSRPELGRDKRVS